MLTAACVNGDAAHLWDDAGRCSACDDRRPWPQLDDCVRRAPVLLAADGRHGRLWSINRRHRPARVRVQLPDGALVTVTRDHVRAGGTR